MSYVYIVECADKTLYTGYTEDITVRLHSHNTGQGAKYTRDRRPVKLRYLELCANKNEALRRESSLKKLSRQAKLNLIATQANKYEK